MKARRSELRPADLGLAPADPGTRRVAGLRREEVAASVAISHDYYTRIEQGRLAPSEPVLEAIAHALRLDPDHAPTSRDSRSRPTGAPRRGGVRRRCDRRSSDCSIS